MIFGARRRDGFRIARVLRAFMRIHEVGHVPGLLVAQHAGLAQRHVGLDEAGRVADLVHAGAPIERVRAPQGGKHPVLAVLLTLAFGAVTYGAVLRIDLAAAHVVGFLGGRGQFAVALAFQHHARWRFAG
ncbi:hypothetical protein D3C72_2027990 [compost metagenome]